MEKTDSKSSWQVRVGDDRCSEDADTVSLKQLPEDAAPALATEPDGVDPYSHVPAPRRSGEPRRTLDDMRKLDEEIKRARAASGASEPENASEPGNASAPEKTR